MYNSVLIDSMLLHTVCPEVPAVRTVTPLELLPHLLTKPSVTVRQTWGFFFFPRQQRASKNHQDLIIQCDKHPWDSILFDMT